MTNENQLRPRRFSEGMEHDPSLPASTRVGSFADGMAMTAHFRTGSFAGGQALRPDAPGARRVGGVADGYVPAAEPVRARPRVRPPRIQLRPRTV
jgi:hypothetical protein